MSDSNLSKLEEMSARIACATLESGRAEIGAHFDDGAETELAAASVDLALKIIAEAARVTSAVPACEAVVVTRKEWERLRKLAMGAEDPTLPASTAAVPTSEPPKP